MYVFDVILPSLLILVSEINVHSLNYVLGRIEPRIEFGLPHDTWIEWDFCEMAVLRANTK